MSKEIQSENQDHVVIEMGDANQDLEQKRVAHAEPESKAKNRLTLLMYRNSRKPKFRFRERRREVDRCPNGYPKLAAYLATNTDFLIFRDFSYLRTRLLLDQQDEICQLEKDLDELDMEDSEGQAQKEGYLHHRRHDRRRQQTETGRSRTEIFRKLEKKLESYDRNLFAMRQVRAWTRPSRRHYESVRNWFKNKMPLVNEEREYIERREDLVVLRLGESETFEGRIEYVLFRLDCRLIRWMFCTSSQKEKPTDVQTIYYEPRRVRILVTIIITTVVSILLLLPIIVLYQLALVSTSTTAQEDSGKGNAHPSTAVSLGAFVVLMAFTLIFCGTMASLTSATRQELFGASAAYCAVLVVFIGNFNGN